VSTPELTIFADELYDRLAPAAWADATQYPAFPLRTYSQALAAMFDQVSEVVHDTDQGPGWSALLDPARCPAWALDWLANVAGVALLPGLDEAGKRQMIASLPGQARGTPAAIAAAVRVTLTGTQYVRVIERYQDDAYALAIQTRTDETPDPAQSLRAALTQKPAGLTLAMLVFNGVLWRDLSVEPWHQVALQPWKAFTT
jgi:Phage tail protein (Tail_P2_I)